MTPHQTLQNLLDDFARYQGITLILDNGVCALRDGNGDEAAVLELPAESDALLLHCALFSVEGYDRHPAAWRLMMTLNFEMNAMRGCWLALDSDDRIRLCHQIPVAALNKQTFTPLLLAFMQQAREARELLKEMFAAF